MTPTLIVLMDQYVLSDIPNTECGGMSTVACDPLVAESRETGQVLIFKFAEFNVNKEEFILVKPELLICTVTPPKEVAVGLMIRMLFVVAV
jgi:hypothetical protein